MKVEFLDGMTVQELKDLLRDWPTAHADGTPTTVHFRSSGYGECDVITVLDHHGYTTDGVGDLILSPFL